MHASVLLVSVSCPIDMQGSPETVYQLTATGPLTKPNAESVMVNVSVDGRDAATTGDLSAITGSLSIDIKVTELGGSEIFELVLISSTNVARLTVPNADANTIRVSVSINTDHGMQYNCTSIILRTIFKTIKACEQFIIPVQNVGVIGAYLSS